MRVRYRGEAGRQLSGFWGNLPIAEIQRGAHDGRFFYDDFNNFDLVTGQTTEYYREGGGIYSGVIEGTSMAQMPFATADSEDGHCRVVMDGTADDNCILQYGGADSNFCSLVPDVRQQVYFEARVRWAQADAQAFFIGLADPNSFAADGVILTGDATSLVTTGAYIGFSVFEGTDDTLIQAYGQAYDTTDNQLQPDVNLLDGPIVASTWYSLGYWFDGVTSRWYVNGDKKAETTSRTVALGLPINTPLVPTLACMTEDTAATFDVDWWAAGIDKDAG